MLTIEAPAPGGRVDDGPMSAPASRDLTPYPVWLLLAAALDELDYGMILLSEGLRVAHINEPALAAVGGMHPLQFAGGELRCRLQSDVTALHDAVSAAALRDLRRLVTLGDAACRAFVSVVPLSTPGSGVRAVLVVLAKRAVCEPLSVEGFARGHGLTSAETRVLLALCDGVTPAEAASGLGVAISTVRSQICSIRAKTSSDNMRSLIEQLAFLPPLKTVLRGPCLAARAAWRGA